MITRIVTIITIMRKPMLIRTTICVTVEVVVVVVVVVVVAAAVIVRIM